MNPVERNHHREAPMPDATATSNDQPLAEAETIARNAGAAGDSVAVGEDAALPDDQPRNQIETAAAIKAAQSAAGPAAFEERTESGPLPGEVIGTPKPPPGPYQFLPGDGQAVDQDERNAEYLARQAEANEQPEAEPDEPVEPEPEPEPEPEDEPKAKSRKSKRNKEQD
jgi:hypothetical protein